MSTGWNPKVEEILKVGHHLLDELGISNWALTKAQALNALEELSKLNVPILGGDVCEDIKGRIEPNYDNWHCDPISRESRTEFTVRSVSESKDYINRYPPSSASTKFYFTITPDD